MDDASEAYDRDETGPVGGDRLRHARARLAAAMARLEAALALPGPGARNLAERDRRVAELERELDRLNREHMALEAMIDHVAARLDAAINRLKETQG